VSADFDFCFDLDFGAVSGASAFDPATLPLSTWWRAPYALPWTPTASAGASGANGNLGAGVPPAATATLNGLAVPSLDGASEYLTALTAAPQGVIWTAGAGTSIVLARVISRNAPTANPYTDAQLFSDNGPNAGMAYSTAGFQGYIYDGAYETSVPIPFALGAWCAFQVTWDSTNLISRVNRTGAAPKPAGAIAGFGASALLGNVGFGTFANADVAEVLTSKVALSTAQMDGVVDYFNARYGLSL
jgi:hypothetical protein